MCVWDRSCRGTSDNSLSSRISEDSRGLVDAHASGMSSDIPSPKAVKTPQHGTIRDGPSGKVYSHEYPHRRMNVTALDDELLKMHFDSTVNDVVT